MNSTTDIQAIDVHGHYGPYVRQGRGALVDELCSASAEEVARRARQCNIEWTVVSPLLGLLPRGQSDACDGNEEAVNSVAQTPGLRQWVIIDPLRPQTFEQAAVMLELPHCLGIKIHPEEHVYPIREYGEAIFRFAAEHRAVVLTHSGDPNSMPADCVTFANQFPEMTLILAHIGCGWDGDVTHQVRAIQESRHGNVLADTSSARSLTPGLIEWAVAEVGAERVLFGTDTPLYATSMQRARIDQAELGYATKKKILRDNAAALLNLKVRSTPHESSV